MSIERIRVTLGLSVDAINFTNWPNVPVEAVPDAKRTRFERRLKACELYCSGKLSANAVARRVGLSPREVLRITHLALRRHPDGQIYGHRGLIPYRHDGEYNRQASEGTGTAGLFNQLLKRFPDIRAEIVSDYCTHGKRLKDIHRTMVSRLAQSGVQASEYPFNTERKAAGALREFCLSMHSERFRQIAHARHGRDAGRRADQTEDHDHQRLILRPYTRVEIDAHKIDAIFVLTIEGPDGIPRTVTLRRLLLIVVLDVASRAVLGYALCLRQTESQTDILTAIERALSDAPPMPITEPGLFRSAGAGLPVHQLPNSAFRAFDEIGIDNNWAATSVEFQNDLAEKLEVRINLGKTATPEGRAFVESFYKKLTENGFQRLPSTTGGSARSPKRRDPEKKALQYHLTLSAAEQISDTLIGEYNNTHHGGIHCTPLEYIRRWDARGGIIRHLPRDAQGLDFLYEQTLLLTVHGGVSTGMRPYVQHQSARYTNAQLGHFTQGVGKQIRAICDRRNVALMKAYSPAGEPMGIIKAQGRWGMSPHSLKTRQAIVSLERKGELSNYSPDPLENYIRYLQQAAKKRRAAANELIRVRRERGEVTATSLAADQLEADPKASASHAETSFQLSLGVGVRIRRATRAGGGTR